LSALIASRARLTRSPALRRRVAADRRRRAWRRLAGKVTAGHPEFRRELGRRPTFAAWDWAPGRRCGEDRVTIARGQRAGALGVADDALDQVRRESPHVEDHLVVIEGD
jgi:hypothetical protein